MSFNQREVLNQNVAFFHEKHNLKREVSSKCKSLFLCFRQKLHSKLFAMVCHFLPAFSPRPSHRKLQELAKTAQVYSDLITSAKCHSTLFGTRAPRRKPGKLGIFRAKRLLGRASPFSQLKMSPNSDASKNWKNQSTRKKEEKKSNCTATEARHSYPHPLIKTMLIK